MKRRLIIALFIYTTLLLFGCSNSKTENGVYEITTEHGILYGLQKAYNKGYENILVKNGNYDVISEYMDMYGSKYFDKYGIDYNNYKHGYYDTGLWLENISVKFELGSYVYCNYNGNNENVKKYFSAFSCGNNVIIDGLTLVSSELRYGIHADFNTGDDESYMIVKNCDLKYSDSTGRCISLGCGLGKHVNWLFEDNFFRSDSKNPVLSIHNNVSSEAVSKITVRNNYIDGNGYFLFNSYSSSILKANVFVYNNCWITSPKIGFETDNSNENMIMYEYNNDCRVNY